MPTVGTGGDYATWAAAIASITSPLTGSLDFEQISDTVEPAIPFRSIFLNGYTLTFRNGTPHGGDPTAGNKITLPVASTRLFGMSLNGAGTFEMKDLNIVITAPSGVSEAMYLTANSTTVLVHDNIVDVSAYPFAATAFRLAAGNSLGTVEAWDCEAYGNGGAIGGGGFSLENEYGGSLEIESCTAVNHGVGFVCGSSTVAIVRDCVAVLSNFFDFQSVGLSAGYNNASEDGTAAGFGSGSGNVTGIVPANEFESTDITNPLFAKLKAGGVLEAGGAAVNISGNTAGIRGNPRPGLDAVYSIGADEYLPLPVVTDVRASLDTGNQRRFVQVGHDPLVVETPVPAGSLIQDEGGVLYHKFQDTATPADDVRRLVMDATAYTVGPVGYAQYQSIQDAIDQAVADGHDRTNPTKVFIQPGTYVEDLDLKPGVNLQGLTTQVLERVGDSPSDITVEGRLSFVLDDPASVSHSVTLENLMVKSVGTGASTVVVSGTAWKGLSFYNSRVIQGDEVTLPIFDVSGQSGRFGLQVSGGAIAPLQPTYAPPVIDMSMANGNLNITNSLIRAGSSSAVAIRVSGANCFVIIGGADAPIASNTGISGAVEFTATATNSFVYMDQVNFEEAGNTSEIIADGTFFTGYATFGRCTRQSSGLKYPIRVSGTNRSVFKEVVVAPSGSVMQYQIDGVEAEQWRPVQLVAAKTDYLVGPAGQAQYTSIQAAIDQAVTDGMSPSSPRTVWVLDGTYDENLTMHPGLTLRAVNYSIFNVESVLDEPGVVINGTISLTNTLVSPPEGAFVQLQGLRVNAPTGNPVMAVTSSATAFVIVQATGCYFRSTNSDVFSITKGSAFGIVVTATLCFLFGDNGRLARVQAGETLVLRNSRSFVQTVNRTVVLAGGSFQVLNDDPKGSANVSINAPIEVEAATSNSVLTLSSVGISQTIDDDVIVAGSLNTTYSYYTEDCVNGNRKLPITVGGANADDFVAQPGVHVRYDYLVSKPGKGGRFTSIQTAIDQAVTDGMTQSNPKTVWVAGGAYTENLTLHPGLYLRSVTKPLFSVEIAEQQHPVTINGTLTFNNTVAPEASVTLQGLRVIAPSGSSALTITSAAVAFTGVAATGCSFESTNADVFSCTKGSAIAIVLSIDLCYTLGSNGRTIRAATGIVLKATNSTFYVSTVTRSVVLAGGTFQAFNDETSFGQNAFLNAPIELEAGSTSLLSLSSVALSQSTGGADVIVDGNASPFSYYTEDCLNTSTGLPITVGGANADDLVARPGVHARYTYLVSKPGGGGRFTSIQAAINRAVADGATDSNPVDAWIMPGTYVEDVTLQPGVSLNAALPFTTEHEGSRDYDVVIDGKLTFAPTGVLSQTVRLRGLYVRPTAGSPLRIDTTNGPASILAFHCKFRPASGSVPFEIVVGGTNDAVITMRSSGIDGSPDPLVTLPEHASLSLESSRLACTTPSGEAVRLTGGSFDARGPEDVNNQLLAGSIRVFSGTTNVLRLIDIGMARLGGASDVIVDVALASGYFNNVISRNLLGANVPEEIVITGAQASSFVEKPGTYDGGIRRYRDDGVATNARRWVDVRNNLVATADPAATNDSTEGYAVGSMWYRTDRKEWFICNDATATAAVWREVALGSGSTHVDAADPTATDDQTKGFDVGDFWLNSTTEKLWQIIDASTGAAVWWPVVNPQVQVLYVSKQGDDTYDGKSPERPKLTFAAAITAGGSPTGWGDSYTVVGLDNGTYTENLTLPQYVSLYAPNARLIGRQILTDDTKIEVGYAECNAANHGVFDKQTGTGTAIAKAKHIKITNSARAFQCQLTAPGPAGTLLGEADLIEAEGAVVMSGAGTAIRVRAGEIRVTGVSAINFPFNGDMELTAVSIVGDATSFLHYAALGGYSANSRIIASNISIGRLVLGAQTTFPLYIRAGTLSYTTFGVPDGMIYRADVAMRTNYIATTAPTANDDSTDGYDVGSVWFDTVTESWWVCKDATATAAVWARISADELDYGYNGVVDPDNDVTVAFTNTAPDRTFSIQPTGSEFMFYSDGEKFRSTGDTIQITAVEGPHYVYYDETGTIQETTAFTIDLITRYCFLAAIHWDATNSKQIMWNREHKHTILMSSRTHLDLHSTRGFSLQSGGALNSIVPDALGDLAAHAQFGNDATKAWDEDAYFDHALRLSTSVIPVYYRTGADASHIWRVNETASFGVLTTGTGRAAWNELTGGNWQQTEAGNGNFVLAHVAVTNDDDRPFVVFQGQGVYSTVSAARESALTEINNLITEGLPSPEWKFIATVIYQTSNGYTNTVKSRIRSTEDGSDYVDLRGNFIGRGGAAGSGYEPLVDQQQVLYVGKHGDDSSNGLSPARAFLTIQAAIAAAGTPASEAAAYTIVVLDDGEYDEDLTHVSYVNVFAPNATLKGTQILADSMGIVARRLINDGNNYVLHKPSGSGKTFVDAKVIDSDGTTSVVALHSGALSLRCAYMEAATDILTLGNLGAACTLLIDVDEIAQLGAFRVVRLLSTGGAEAKVYGRIGKTTGIAGSTGILTTGTGSETHLTLGEFACATAYNIGASNMLRLFVGNLAGTETIAAGADVHVTKAGGRDRVQTYYVGKGGQDTLDGTTPDKRVLTIAQALTLAGTPANEAAAVTIEVVDDGTYTENVLLPSYVNLHAPEARVVGAVGVKEYASAKVRIVEPPTDTNGVGKFTGAGAGPGYIDVDTVVTIGTGIGVVLQEGELHVRVRKVTSAGGGISASAGTLHVDAGLVSAGGTALSVTGAAVRGQVHDLTGVTALSVGSGSIDATVHRVNGSTAAWSITGGTTRLFVANVSGTETISDGVSARIKVAKRHNYIATTDPTVNDDSTDGYNKGSQWVNTLTRRMWVCLDPTATAAIWHDVSRNDITAVFGDKALSYWESKNATYEATREFIFPGTGVVGTPYYAKWVISGQAGLNGSIRLYDLTNAQVIAEITGITATAKTIYTDSTLTNLPAGEAIFEWQARDVNGKGIEVWAATLGW